MRIDKQGLYFLFIIISMLVSGHSFAANKKEPIRPKVHYEPEEVTLVGKMELQTFIAANYVEGEPLKKDNLEKGWYLRLESPVDVIATKPHDDINCESEYNVKIVQLVVLDPDTSKKIRAISVGTTLKITGALFRRFSSHHHSRVLLGIKTLEIIK